MRGEVNCEVAVKFQGGAKFHVC